jgi:hypothetical protein
MTTSASISTLVDPAYLQRRTLELGREAVEGKRELSALLGDAFQELRAARASSEALQHELRQRDDTAARVALPPQDPLPADSAPLEPVQPHGRRTMRIPAIVAKKFDAGAGLLDEPLPGQRELLAAVAAFGLAACGPHDQQRDGVGVAPATEAPATQTAPGAAPGTMQNDTLGQPGMGTTPGTTGRP